MRLYLYNASDNSGQKGVYVDNLVLNGTLVPEPEACALISGMGLLGFTLMRRCHRSRLRLRRSAEP